MSSSGIEELKSVLGRSAVLIIAVVLVGVVGMNAIRQLSGPSYDAHARVLLDNGDLSAAVLGINPGYQDPSRVDQAEQNLVNSPQLYNYAAKRVDGHAGTGAELQSKTSVNVSNNVVEFTVKAGNEREAWATVNTVATAYPEWRALVRGQAVSTAIARVREQIARVGKTTDLENQLQQLQVLKALSSGETLFVEQASGATKTRPKPVSDSLLGGALGLVIALLLVGGRELFNTTVRSESEIEDVLQAPVLATIESLPRRMRTSVLAADGTRFNDEYELLAANVAHVFGGQSRTVQIAITSASPGEGKTTTATNLAAALSRRGATVVLADFDLRKPAVSDLVGIPRGAAGVTELLAGAADLRSVLWRVHLNGGGSHLKERAVAEPARVGRARTQRVREDDGELAEGSLTVVPGGEAGRTDYTPPFARLPGLLDGLAGDADFVVIDTPPALLVAGMAELAQSVDGVIVVVRHGVVHRRRLRTLGRQTRSWRADLIGAVLNDSPGQPGNLNYYYGRP